LSVCILKTRLECRIFKQLVQVRLTSFVYHSKSFCQGSLQYYKRCRNSSRDSSIS
jgi:hypothetical protein